MPDPARNDDPLAEGAFTLGLLALSFTSLLYLSSLVIPPVILPRITLAWDNPPETPGSYSVEVWASTNLVTWQLKTNVSGTNHVTLAATNRQEFFKIRTRGTNGQNSDWSHK
jgi:hypothetical protein